MKLRIKVEGISYEVDVEVLPDTSEEGSTFVVPESVMQPPALLDIRPQDKLCRSPIAGVVVAIAAAVNQRVRQDDPIVVIEAMKMQTSIGAPVEGVVSEMHVQPGELVKPGQLLCTIL